MTNFQGRPRTKKVQKREKILFSGTIVLKMKLYLEGLAIFHTYSVCEGVWKIVKPPKFGFSFSKQAYPETFQMQLVYHKAGCASN